MARPQDDNEDLTAEQVDEDEDLIAQIRAALPDDGLD